VRRPQEHATAQEAISSPRHLWRIEMPYQGTNCWQRLSADAHPSPMV
jgi:hypothetical protein